MISKGERAANVLEFVGNQRSLSAGVRDFTPGATYHVTPAYWAACLPHPFGG